MRSHGGRFVKGSSTWFRCPLVACIVNSLYWPRIESQIQGLECEDQDINAVLVELKRTRKGKVTNPRRFSVMTHFGN